MLKRLTVTTTISLCILALLEIPLSNPVKAQKQLNHQISFVYYIHITPILHRENRVENWQFLFSNPVLENKENFLSTTLEDAIFVNLSHKLYGISKSIQRKLGLEDTEIDDGTESIFREYGVFLLLFGGLFGWIVYKSLSSTPRR